jgi:hypothetical protein
MFLTAHGLFRWVVLASVAVRAGVAVHGAATGRIPGAPDRRASLVAMITTDLQFLTGILLYVVFSPLTEAARGNVKAAMKDPELRWALVEHPLLMVLTIGIAHVSNVLTKRATDAGRQRVLAGLNLLAVALMLAGTWRRMW